MNLTYLGAGAFTVGLLGLLGVTYLLQRLRVRHEERVVVTTMFWRQALEEERARVLVERFRHPWAWLLIAGITSLLWLALSRPALASGEERAQLVLVESSTDAQEFASRIETAGALIDSLPRDRTEVVLLGAQLDTLLRAEETPALFGQRAIGSDLAGLAVGLDDAVLRLVRSSDRPVDLHLVGETHLRQSTVDALGDRLDLRRVRGADDAASDDAASGARLLGLGLAPSSDGDPERVDLLASIRTESVESLEWSRGDESLDATPVVGQRDGVVSFRFDGLRADGSTIRVSGRGLEAAIALPTGRRIRVAIDEALGLFARGLLIRAIDADPGLERGAVGDADVLVGAAVGSKPTLAFVAPEEASGTFVLRSEAGADMDRMVSDLALDQIDATSLATELGLPVTVDVDVGSDRGAVVVDRRVLGPRMTFTGSRAFPLFIGGAIRWLANAPTPIGHAAVGEPVAGVDAAVLDADGRRLELIGDAFVPLRAGVYRLDDGRTFVASVQAPLDGVALEDNEAVTAESGGSVPPFARVALLLVLGLLGLEWFLVRRGRMP